MKIIHAKDYNDLSRKAANIISAQVILKPESVFLPSHRFLTSRNLPAADYLV